MSASPEFYKPAPVFPPCSSPLLLHGGSVGVGGGGAGAGAGAGAGEQEGASGVREEYCCRTPTGDGSELKQAPGTCPPAPRKPRAPPAPCRKRLFEVEVFSLRLEELERLFWRPHAPSSSPASEKKKRPHAPSSSPAPEKKKRRRVAPPAATPEPSKGKS